MTDTKTNQQNISAIKDEKKLAQLEAQRVREVAFKLAIKIICWESGSLDTSVIKSTNKITKAEWSEYSKQRMSLITAENEVKSKEKLMATFNSIKANGGFE